MHNIDLTLPLYTTSLNSITSELRTTQTIALLGRTEVRIRGWVSFNLVLLSVSLLDQRILQSKVF
jgi:hypothetical protein